MLTILNQTLPLYFMLLPLCIAAYLANKYYKWKAKYYKAQFTAETNALQLIRDFERHKAQLEELNKNSVSLAVAMQCTEQLKDVTAKLHKAESDAVEREILVRTLRADISNDSEIWQGRIKDKVATICDKQVEIGQLERQIAELKLTEQFNEAILSSDAIVQNQLRDEIAELKDLNDILYGIIQANSRTRKAYDKYLTSKPIAGADESAPLGKIIHDNIGNVTVRLADQSESVNNRHGKLIKQALQKGNEIIELCDEVNRGIKEQAERIRKELEVVDMSQLESGDAVKLRNGNSWVVSNISHDASDISVLTYFVDGYWYSPIGRFIDDTQTHESDIIQIIKPAKSEVKFKPQVDEAVHIKASRGNFKVKEVSVQGNGYLLASESNGIAHFRFISELAPIKGYRYENGFISNDTCYKTNKPCEFGCYGLCKESQ